MLGRDLHSMEGMVESSQTEEERIGERLTGA